MAGEPKMPPRWALWTFAVLVTAIGLVLGVWLRSRLSGTDEVRAVAVVRDHHPGRHSKVDPPHAPVEVQTLQPASAGLNHPHARRRHSHQRRHPHPVPAPAATPEGGAAAQASFASLAATIGGPIGLASAPLGSSQPETFGELQVGHAWSSMKVPILTTLMREGPLSPEEEGWAAAALTASDNEAAASLFGQLEGSHGGLVGASLAVQETLGAAGDVSTQIATAPPPPGAVSTWGQTEWSLSDSVDFYRALACGELLAGDQSSYVLGLMEEVIPEQQWGLGQAGFPVGTSVAFKAGWGPEAEAGGGYLVRQAGIIRSGSTGTVVTMMAKDPSGSFEAGVEDIDQIADWVSEHLPELGSGSC
jgi:hypothetical protein